MKAWAWRAWSARWMGMAGILLAAAQAGAVENDKVVLVAKNETIVGKITKDDKDGLELEIRAGGAAAKRTFTSAEIRDVDWDVSEEGFHEAVTAYRSGSYGKAANDFGTLAQKETLDRIRGVARPYILYMHAESLYQGGKAGEAYAAYQKLVGAFPNSRYVPYALSNMANAAIQSKAFDKLPALLAQLREGGAEQKQLADYYEGEALFVQGKPKDALSKYANASVGASGRVKAMALVGQGRAHAASGDSAKSREAAQAALALNPPERMASQAHGLTGDAILADAEAKKLSGTQLQDALLDAVLEFMRVKVQYDSDALTEGNALLKTGECFQKLSSMPGRAGSDDRERAIGTYNKIGSDRRFANSEFANKALKHLDEMKEK